MLNCIYTAKNTLIATKAVIADQQSAHEDVVGIHFKLNQVCRITINIHTQSAMDTEKNSLNVWIRCSN